MQENLFDYITTDYVVQYNLVKSKTFVYIIQHVWVGFITFFIYLLLPINSLFRFRIRIYFKKKIPLAWLQHNVAPHVETPCLQQSLEISDEF